MKHNFIIVILFLCQSLAARASSFEAAGAMYNDDSRSTQITGLKGEYTHSPRRSYFRSRPLSIGLGYTRKAIGFKDPSSFVVEDQLEGQSDIIQNDLSLSLTQNLNLTTDVSVFGSLSDSPLATSKTYGLAASKWVRKDTLKLQVSLSQNTAEQVSGEIYDTDQSRVKLPSDLAGQNYSGSFTHYTTPVLITTGSLSFTQRSDRPAAHSQTLGVRRFIKQTHSAIHVEGGHYANIGQLTDQSLYGPVQAYSLKSEWHQKLFLAYQGLVGYRYYSENVSARHDLEVDKNLASDSIYAMLKYRFGHKRWLETSNEVNTFVEQYSTNEPRNAMLVGIGLVANFR